MALPALLTGFLSSKFSGWVAILSTIGLIIIGWSFYAGIIRPITKPTPTTTVQAGGVSNTYEIKPTFGCISIQALKAAKELQK